MQPTHLMTLFLQEPLKHPASRKGKFVVQPVDPIHQLQVALRYAPGAVIDTAPADPQKIGLTRHAQLRTLVNHRFALANRPAFGLVVSFTIAT